MIEQLINIFVHADSLESSNTIIFEQQMAQNKQQEMKEEIKSFMRRKDYYQILGISKTAQDSQIKKAYRMLALKFHPDKNQTEGTPHHTQAQKKYSKKYPTPMPHLQTQKKRKYYDQVGPEEDRPRPQYHRAGAHGEEQYQEFQDIFQAFFGGVPMQRQRNFRGYQFNNFQRQGHAHGQGHQQQGQGFNFYYIFIVFFLIYTILPLFQSSPNYSSTASYQHRIKRVTSRLNVEYYTNQKFLEEARNIDYLRKAQMEMDRQFLLQLEQKCEYLKGQKRNLQVYAYQHKEGRQRQNYLSRAKTIDMTPCRYLQQVSNTHQDYVRELTYMRY